MSQNPYPHINLTIPKSVQEAAQIGIDLHKQYQRGGTDVGLNTARILSQGGKIDPEKVRHIAAYFPRHTARDNLTQDGSNGQPPSNGWIAYQLWGGKAGQEWSSKLVEEMNKADQQGKR